MIWFLTASASRLEGLDEVEVRGLDLGRVDRAAEPGGLMFEEVHLSEQVHLLLAGQERVAVEARPATRRGPRGA